MTANAQTPPVQFVVQHVVQQVHNKLKVVQQNLQQIERVEFELNTVYIICC